MVSLLIPGFNDTDQRNQTKWPTFLPRWRATSVARDRLSPRLQDGRPRRPPPAATLIRVAGMGRAAGLHYVYAGNLPGQVGDLEDTRCAVVRRRASSPATATASRATHATDAVRRGSCARPLGPPFSGHWSPTGARSLRTATIRAGTGSLRAAGHDRALARNGLERIRASRGGGSEAQPSPGARAALCESKSMRLAKIAVASVNPTVGAVAPTCPG